MPKARRIPKNIRETPPCLCSALLGRRRVFTTGRDGYSIRVDMQAGEFDGDERDFSRLGEPWKTFALEALEALGGRV